jgi:hypothetical protein
VVRKIFSIGILVALILFSLPIDAIKAAENTKNGSAEVMMMLVSEEGQFTETQKQELKQAGWNVEGDTIFLTRTLANQTLIVDGKEVQTDGNGEFEVDENSDEITVKLPGGEDYNIFKNDEGKFKFTEVADWNSFNEEMDFAQSQTPNDTTATNSTTGEEYNSEEMNLNQSQYLVTPLTYGKKYKKGDWVHCNRWNGPHTDDYHYPKTNWKALRNFVGSDCDRALAARCLKDYTSNTWCNGSGGPAACSGKIGHSKRYHKHKK